MNNISYAKLFGTLLDFLGTNKKRFLIWNIPIILASIFSLIQPLLIGGIIDFFTEYTAGQLLNTFYLYLGLFLAGTVVAAILKISARGVMYQVTADLEYSIKTQGFDNIQNNSLSWQQGENSGNKIQRIETGKNALLDLVELIKDDIYTVIIGLIGILAVFIAINPLFLVFFVIYATLQFALLRYWDNKDPAYIIRINMAKELSVGKLFEGLTNIQTIKSLGATSSFQTTINSSQHELREATKAREKMGVYKWISVSAFGTVFTVIFFLLIGYSVINGLISVGFIFVLYTYFNKLESIVWTVATKLGKLIEIRTNVERMLPLFESVTHNTGEKEFPTNWSSISLKDIGFEYSIGESNAVFNNISLSIDKGSFIGITGESGSGKSSLLKVLLGLYPLASGSYSIGDANFYDISHTEILENMTVVLQETELFNVSLLENITMFKEVDGTLLENSIKVAQLDDVIQSLPEGLDTVIGEKGTKLSGGQRQRIGIARAIYKNSPILLLDEATSNLDYETEKRVMQGILNVGQDKTIVAVAHRLSTLEGAHDIYKFEAGQFLHV